MELFADIETACCMAGTDDPCVCSRKEAVVRMYASGNAPRALTDDERKNLVDDANHAGEGYYTRDELMAKRDEDLAAATLNAWSMYVQSQL